MTTEREHELLTEIAALQTRLDWLAVEIDKMVDDYASYPSDGLADWTVIINLAKLVGRWKDNGDGSGSFTLLSGRGGR